MRRYPDYDNDKDNDLSNNAFGCLFWIIIILGIIVYFYWRQVLLISVFIAIGIFIYKKNKDGAIWKKGDTLEDVKNKTQNQLTEFIDKQKYTGSVKEALNGCLGGVTPWNKDKIIEEISKKISDGSTDPIDKQYIGLIKEVVYEKFNDQKIVESKTRLNGLIERINFKLSSSSKNLFSNELQVIKSLANVLSEKNKDFKKSSMDFLDSNIGSLRYSTVNNLISKIAQQITAIVNELNRLISNLNALESKTDNMLKTIDKSLVEQNFGGNAVEYDNFSSEISNALSAQINSLEETIKVFENKS